MLKLNIHFFCPTHFLRRQSPKHWGGKEKKSTAIIQDTFSYFILLLLKVEKPHQQIYQYKYI